MRAGEEGCFECKLKKLTIVNILQVIAEVVIP